MRNLRNEAEIMASWKGDPDKPVVSICCITYNHELYIEDALEGFLIQDTDFPFEILVHDDASTDKTTEIIREYESKYPRLIKPIYQTVNQFSQGRKINVEFNFTRVKSEFIALCEGDDYWLQADKLQRQVNLHRSYKNVTMSCHQAIELNVKENTNKIIFKPSDEDKLIKPEEIIIRKYGYIPTASMMISTRYLSELESFFKFVKPPVGDYFIQLFMALNGEVYYLNSITSVYRKNLVGSWSQGQLEIEKQKTHRKAMVESLERSWEYFKLNPKANFIGIPWAKNVIGIAIHSSSKLSKFSVILRLSPRVRMSCFRLLIRYYFHILQKFF